jgi:hypothetical protein
MVEATPKALAIAAILFVVGAMSSGYLFSIGADLWELTKQPLSLTLQNTATFFWIVSVPLGVVGIALALLAVLRTRQRSKVLERPEELAKKFAEEKQKLEEIDRDRRTIYDAIREWVQPPQVRWQIGKQEEPLYLGERVPRHAQKIDDCLTRNYPEIWVDLQRFRSKYTELMDLETNIPDEFREEINGVTNLRLDLLDARKGSMHRQLVAIQRQVIRQINLEIVEKLDTGLKC